MSVEQLYVDEFNLASIVAGNIRAEAARRGLSQSALARALGMKQPSVNERWRGKTDWTLKELGRVAEIFEMPVESLISGTPASRVTAAGAAARLKGLEPPTF